jgi:hypothetical protein
VNPIRSQLRTLLVEPDALAIVLLALVLGIGADTMSGRPGFVIPCGAAVEDGVFLKLERLPEFSVGRIALAPSPDSAAVDLAE